MEQSIRIIKDNLLKAGGKDVLIVAATKMVGTDRINRLKDYGIFDAGENRVQELMEKYDGVSDIKWHFIGNLQKNKVKYIIDKVCLIHSVDNESLLDEIEKRVSKINKTIDILIEVNIGGETTKGGVSAERLFDLCDYAASLPHIRLRGIMSVMPAGCGEELYKSMNRLFCEVRCRYGEGIDYLSVGMSGDYEIAVRNGANLIRPGSAIFGKRSY